MGARGAALVLAFAGALTGAADAAAAPLVHAHRGGSYVDGDPTYPENTMLAFRAAARVPGVVLEMDTKLTADGVPVVIHDATFDRTTPCSGPVEGRTLAQLADCPADVLGSPGSSLPSAQAQFLEPIPTVIEALTFARDAGATVNLEIKNQPTDADFDLGSGFATRVLDAIVASGFPQERLIVQSFWPPNLDAARARLPRARLSLLTLAQMNGGAPEYALLSRYPIISPAWPVDGAFMVRARVYGKEVVPYTLNTAAQVTAASELGVDAIITDDPSMALRALGAAAGPPEPAPDPPPAPAPRVEVTAPRSTRARSFIVRWRALAAGAATYDVRVRSRGRSRILLSATTRARVRFRARRGVRYEFLVRSRGRDGAPGPYSKAVTRVRR